MIKLGLALLLGAVCAHAPHHHHRPGLNCKNVQTMTTQWLCEKR